MELNYIVVIFGNYYLLNHYCIYYLLSDYDDYY